MIPYTRTTPFTTAAASLLSILHYFNPKIELSKENEFKIWHNSANLPTRSCSIYGLANYAQKCGLKTKIVVEKKEYNFPDYRFYRYKKEDIEHAAYSSNLHRKEVEESGMTIEIKEILLEDVKKELANNKIILLRINAKPIRNTKRNTTKYIVVHGYEENYFHIIDPAQGGLSVPEEVMKESFYSLETKKYRDHRMIVFERKTIYNPNQDNN